MEFKFRNNVIYVNSNLSETEVNTKIIAMLVDTAYATFRKKLNRFSKMMGVKYGELMVFDFRDHFAYVNRFNDVIAPLRAIMMNDFVIDAMLVHGLAHIEYKEHSAAFYDLVENTLPDYRERLKAFEDNGYDALFKDNGYNSLSEMLLAG